MANGNDYSSDMQSLISLLMSMNAQREQPMSRRALDQRQMSGLTPGGAFAGGTLARKKGGRNISSGTSKRVNMRAKAAGDLRRSKESKVKTKKTKKGLPVMNEGPSNYMDRLGATGAYDQSQLDAIASMVPQLLLLEELMGSNEAPLQTPMQ